MHLLIRVFCALLLLILPFSTVVAALEQPAREADTPGVWVDNAWQDDAGLPQEEIARLASNPYLPGYQPPPQQKGVTVYDAQRAQPGLNLFSSGHEPSVILMDMAGDGIMRWGRPCPEEWADDSHDLSKLFYRTFYVYPNGDALVLHDFIGIIKLDKDSNILWKRRDGNHHSIAVDGEGRVYSLYQQALSAEELRQRYPGIPCGPGLLDDGLIVYDASGAPLRRISLLDAFYNSPFAAMLLDMPRDKSDIFHANSIHLLTAADKARCPIYADADALVSMRNLNALALLDFETGKVTWACKGQWWWQHSASVLPNGNILLFDNQAGGDVFKKNRSKILAFDPLTMRRTWEYTDNGEPPFYSEKLGYVQALANGNFLVTESMRGRVFEVAPDKEIVWEFLNPFRAGENESFIAIVNDMRRIDNDYLQLAAP